MATAEPPPTPLNPAPVNLKALLICLGVGGALWVMPVPTGLTLPAWHLFCLFVATILGIIIKPLPMGAVTLVSLTLCIVTGTIPAAAAFNGFSSQVVWLVVMAFFIAKGFVVTHFGRRIAYFFTGLLGKKTLGLSYGIAATDLLMAPAVPSVTARCAGIVYPIVQSIASSYQSFPNHSSSRKIGGFLTLCSFQITVITSAMFMTAMAANPLLAELSQAQEIPITWGKWALAACVPGLCSLIVIPWLIYKLYPPEITATPDAPAIANQQLKQMGPMQKSEWIMAATLGLLLVLWIFGDVFNVSAVVAAMIGLCILLLTGVLDWKELLKEKSAWETFFWFCVLLMMAKHLNDYGLTQWFSQHSIRLFSDFPYQVGLPLLVMIYFYSHYFFASSTAHVSSMYPAFLLVAIGLGAPPYLSAFCLIFSSNLFGGLTHYSLAPAPLLYGVGYVDIQSWWKIGFIVSLVNLSIWGTVGVCWWKLLGLF